MLLKCAGMNVGVTQENLFYRGPPYKRQAHLVYEATTTLSMEVWPEPTGYLLPFWKIATIFAIPPALWGLLYIKSKIKKEFSS